MATASVDVLDGRALGKPIVFSGKETEWSDWKFVFMSWLAMLDSSTFVEATKVSAAKGVIVHLDLSEETVRRSEQLFHILVMMVKGRALEILKSVSLKGDMNGYEAFRLIWRHYEPESANRSMGLLYQVLNPKFSASHETWLDDLMRWESELDRYHAMSTERLPEKILVAILIQHAPAANRQHVQLNAASLAHNYQRARVAVETCLLSTRSWSAAGAGSSDGATPMEVDALWIKGKDKGKDKGK